MNSPSNAMPGSLEPSRTDAAEISIVRSLYWSVRRELWESRSIYLAPLAVAGLFLVGFAASLVRLPSQMRATLALDPMKQQDLIERHYDLAALLLMGTFLVVAIFYCLDALHGERRDRSILFWKSLPVSDFTVVMSKALIPLLLLPLITWTITVALQLVMLLLSTVVLLATGQSVSALWTHVPIVRMSMLLLYHLVAMHGLIYAPFYSWMMLVSGWARRATFLWAALPPLVIGFFEKIAFNTSYFSGMLLERFAGGPETVSYPAPSSMMQNMVPPSMTMFLISPSLWVGLVVSAIFLAAAVRLRRYQGPV